jgi:superfamily I DNA/RNA helicase
MEEDLLPHKRSIEERPHRGRRATPLLRRHHPGQTHLTISRCLTRRKYGTTEQRNPSRFLAEIPEHLLNFPDGAADGGKDSDDLAADFFARAGGVKPVYFTHRRSDAT